MYVSINKTFKHLPEIKVKNIKILKQIFTACKKMVKTKAYQSKQIFFKATVKNIFTNGKYKWINTLLINKYPKSLDDLSIPVHIFLSIQNNFCK